MIIIINNQNYELIGYGTDLTEAQTNYHKLMEGGQYFESVSFVELNQEACKLLTKNNGIFIEKRVFNDY